MIWVFSGDGWGAKSWVGGEMRLWVHKRSGMCTGTQQRSAMSLRADFNSDSKTTTTASFHRGPGTFDVACTNNLTE